MCGLSKGGRQVEFVLSIERWIHLLAGGDLDRPSLLLQLRPGAGDCRGQCGQGRPRAGRHQQVRRPAGLLWFRWAAVVTWVSGALYLMSSWGFVEAFTLGATMDEPSKPVQIIGVGAWLGTIMLFNVWVLIWPNQKKILGIVAASDDEKNRARRTALLASRTKHDALDPHASLHGRGISRIAVLTRALAGGGGPLRPAALRGEGAGAPAAASCGAGRGGSAQHGGRCASS